ncbi:YwaF family protein [Streptococcus sp. DD12]|uniref:YwaF family protein n=1 Tax=Streptococcus sp. DD12 TaxID=1777880 RepID=UPI000831A100|nr:TIGR02206 family membrane protein [Streptococcus sp. DD12]
MSDFLTTHQTQPPTISVFWYLVIVMVFIGLVTLTLVSYKKDSYRKCFLGLQIFQLLILYGWYLSHHIPLSNSLPFYHCRLAMFALVFLPDRWPLKQYFALLGVSGAAFALGYPVFDPYSFPHITSFSFLLGHYCLLVNGLVYLLRHFGSERLSAGTLVLWTFALDAFLLGVNALTGGNYGLLKHPPIMPDDHIWLNYLVVSGLLSAMLLLIHALFRRGEKRSRRVLETVKAELPID